MLGWLLLRLELRLVLGWVRVRVRVRVRRLRVPIPRPRPVPLSTTAIRVSISPVLRIRLVEVRTGSNMHAYAAPIATAAWVSGVTRIWRIDLHIRRGRTGRMTRTFATVTIKT